jgi:hypothetical protein
MNILNTIAGAGRTVLGMAAINAPTATAIAGLIGVAAGAMGKFSGPDHYAGALSGLQGAITDGYTAALSANVANVNQIVGGIDQSGNVFPADYGLLKMIGENIVHGIWSWPIQDLVTPAERTYATQCWQTLMGVSSFVEEDYQYQFVPYHYAYNNPLSDTTWGLLAKIPTGVASPYPATTLSALFDPINTLHWHPLAANMDWVYRDFSNGWPSLGIGTWPGETNDVVSRPSLDPRIEVDPNLTRDVKTGEIVVTITIANRGVQNATNAHLTSVRLGRQTRLPNTAVTHHFLRSNYPETLEVRFPALAAGTRTELAIRGEYKGGTFGGSFRVTIPK